MTEAQKKTSRAGERKQSLQKKSLAAATFALVALLATTASAQTAQAKPTAADGFMDQTDKDGQKVIFKDDPLAADNRGATGATILVRPSAGRVGLLRPRVQFVTEMLKSVENL
jgi:hypothetical protein